MSSLFSILNTGRQGILAQQVALSVTSNNIANVNTPGYSKETADLESLVTGGVSVASVQRLNDDFLSGRLRNANAEYGASSTLATNLQSIESALGDSTDTGLSTDLGNFFSALQDLSQQPADSANRESLRSSAQQLSTSFASLSSQLGAIRGQLDDQVVQSVNQVNTLTSQIAALNGQITNLGGTAAQAQHPEMNQMLDSRALLLDQLSQIVPVKAVANPNGSMTVFVAGQVLIDGARQQKLSTVVSQANGGCHEVVTQDCAGNNVSLDSTLSSGTLGGLLQARDTYAKDAQDQADRISAQLIQKFNIQHRAGTGLDGVSGRDFFSGLSAQAMPAWNNKGGVSVGSATITDDTQLTFDDYEVRFTSAGQFNVVDTTSGNTVSSNNAYVPGGSIDIAGMRLVLNNGSGAPAAGDVIAINSYAGTAGRMDLSAAVKASTGAIAAGQTSAAGDNTNALKLADLGRLATMGQPPSQTFQATFDAARLLVSTASQNAQSRETDSQTTQSQIQALADSVSGVSVDEETTNILQFQRGFQASSQLISVTDQLMQSLLTMMTNG